MIWFRLPVKYRAWWDTDFARGWSVTETMGRLWAAHLAPLPHPIEANDKDHVRW